MKDFRKVFGVDFTSAPSRKKPITAVECWIDGSWLCLQAIHLLTDFQQFEAFLNRSGPWVGSFDFPFNLPKTFVIEMGWPLVWSETMAHLESLEKHEYERAIKDYQDSQPPGRKLHFRQTDRVTASSSPMKLVYPPVGKMLFQGAPKLWRSGVCVVPQQMNDDPRQVLEGYPAMVARRLIQKQPYKSDEKSKQTQDRLEARQVIIAGLQSDELLEAYGVKVSFESVDPTLLWNESSADQLDALLCAVQAAWAWRQRHNNYGIPADVDVNDGWIVDPAVAPPVGLSVV
ncbi:MAG: DUF429 domain-containing protein [Vampirovibrio sp.]|nr:DUF429 domain-containing protein [Vampirovibrio sp.]